MPKTRFFGLRWAFWPVLGAGWPNDYVGTRPNPQNPPKFENAKKKFIERVLTQFFFRLLKHPKRLGLGQKVPGKRSLGPNEPRFMGPKTHE